MGSWCRCSCVNTAAMVFLLLTAHLFYCNNIILLSANYIKWTYYPYGKYYVINCVMLNAIYYINLLVLNRICTIYEYLTELFIHHNMVILPCVVIVYTERKEWKPLSCTKCGNTKLCPNIGTQRDFDKSCVNLVIIKVVVHATLLKNGYVSYNMVQLNNICIISDFLCDYKTQIKLPVKPHMLNHTESLFSCTDCDTDRNYNIRTLFLDIFLEIMQDFSTF